MADRHIEIPTEVLDGESKLTVTEVLGCAKCPANGKAIVEVTTPTGEYPIRVRCQRGPKMGASPCDVAEGITTRKV